MSKVGLNVRDIDIEFNKISVKLIVTVFQESVVLSLELFDVAREFIDNVADVLKVVLLKGLELLDSTEQVNEFTNTSFEEVKASENLSGREIELLSLGHVLKSLFGELVLGLVGLMKSLALRHNFDELIMRDDLGFPKNGIVHTRTTLLRFGGLGTGILLEGKDVSLTVIDHLVSDLDEETGHTLIGVVVTSDSVDHLNGVHKDGESFANAVRCSIIERLNESLKSLEVLNIILSLVQVFSNSKLNRSPVGESEVDSGIRCLSIR